MVIRKLIKLIAIFTLMLSAQIVQAGVIIDDFTDYQTVMNGENGPLIVTGTNLSNLTRTITAKESMLDSETKVIVKNGNLNISNDTDSSGTVSIFYGFNTINLATLADEFLFNVNLIDLKDEVRVQIIANLTSFSDVVTLSGKGQYQIEFSQFTHPNVFNELKSLQLNFSGIKSWDARLDSLTADARSVPEPSILVLLAVGLMALNQSGKRKTL